MADKSILTGNIKAILDQTEEQIRPIFTEVMTLDNNSRIMESEKYWEILEKFNQLLDTFVLNYDTHNNQLVHMLLSEHDINQLNSFGTRNFLITHWLAYRSGQMIAQVLLRDWSRKLEIEKKFGKMLALAHWLGEQTPRGISTILRLAEDLIIGPGTPLHDTSKPSDLPETHAPLTLRTLHLVIPLCPLTLLRILVPPT